MMSRDDFFKSLYQNSDGHIELRALPSKKRLFVEINGFEAAFRQIDRFCKENEKDHLYFGVATRDGKGGGKENITNFPAVFCDIDFKDTPKEVVWDKLKKFPYKPSIMVASGGGAHLYWILKEPVGQSSIADIEEVNRRIADALGGDHAACDASRILRIPDTVNHKYPKRCAVATSHDLQYSLDDFLDILPESEGRSSPQVPSKEPADTPWIKEAMIRVCQRDPERHRGQQ